MIIENKWLSALIGLGLLWLTESIAAQSRYRVSAQALALAPNAGGQEAYSLKLSEKDWEASIFSNQYLLAGDYPMTGASYGPRFDFCELDCWTQLSLITAVGGSNGGPLAEITWSAWIPLLPIWLPMSAPRFLPQLRLDFTTQLIFIRFRTVSWSYPLWLGIGIEF